MSKLLQERWMRLAFAPNSTTVRINEADEADKSDPMYDNCWDGYRRVAGTERGEKGSCELDEQDEALQETENNLWDNIRKAQKKPKSQRNHPNSKEYQSAKKAAKEINNEADESHCDDENDELQETDENPFMAKIAHAAVDGEDKVIIGDKEYEVDMDPETAEEITGEKLSLIHI